LSFGLVSFPVQAFNARNPEQSDIHFHQLHAACHKRIHYQKVCPIHGQVSNDEIVSGYEYAKGKYVEVEPEELDALRTETERSLTIDAFVEPDAIDPIYFDGRMYYLAPEGPVAEEPYAVVTEAMEREGRYGVGQVVFSGKDQLALVRPDDGVLHMAMLNYEAEIRHPREVVAAAKQGHLGGRKVQLAQTLIRSWFRADPNLARNPLPNRALSHAPAPLRLLARRRTSTITIMNSITSMSTSKRRIPYIDAGGHLWQNGTFAFSIA
jgi:DNA end-binding protein Ku